MFVGLAWGKIEAFSPERAHVFQMWVAPSHRRRGLGRRLLAEIVGWARDSGARRVLLDATRGNTPAEHLDMSAGFEPTGGPEPLRPGTDLMSQEMCLTL
jgi:GNAT superfamily N-acetyltransferase